MLTWQHQVGIDAGHGRSGYRISGPSMPRRSPDSGAGGVPGVSMGIHSSVVHPYALHRYIDGEAIIAGLGGLGGVRHGHDVADRIESLDGVQGTR
jgi:hypothetical protein